MRIRVKVAPGARCAAIVGAHGDGWKVRVRAEPSGGKANQELVHLLASVLGVDRRSITIVAGRTSRDKTVEIADAEPEAVRRALKDASHPESSGA